MPGARGGEAGHDSAPAMPEDKSPAAKFIDESVNHPEWLKTIETGDAGAVVKLAADHGFPCSLDDLKTAAKAVLGTEADQGEPTGQEVDEAAAGMSDFENDTGYGNDTGYAALFGVAGAILKM